MELVSLGETVLSVVESWEFASWEVSIQLVVESWEEIVEPVLESLELVSWEESVQSVVLSWELFSAVENLGAFGSSDLLSKIIIIINFFKP